MFAQPCLTEEIDVPGQGDCERVCFVGDGWRKVVGRGAGYLAGNYRRRD